MNEIKNISIFYRKGIPNADDWKDKITQFISKNKPGVEIISFDGREDPDAVIVLGGDGTIIEAAQKYKASDALIFGLNLGQIGFMASVRREDDFIKGLEKFLDGNFRKDERMMMDGELIRNGKSIKRWSAINDIIVQNIFGIVRLKVEIEGHTLQYIRGTGILVSTATGSTAYNMSAHGPIVMPGIKCFIITEILDHNIPTPSVVINKESEIEITVEDFRKSDKFVLAETGEKTDVILSVDGSEVFSLQVGDKIIIKRSEKTINFVELEKNYFFKSLQEKFAFE